jgi:mRNA-degrading endonuclease YafQ of YafQ-DinJ toxin-antitoxin module
MMATDKRLAPGEAFVLLAAAYLHNIGMQNEMFAFAGGDLDDMRDAHVEQTAEMIYAVFEDQARQLGCE